jgi:hypothetical protein
MPDILGRLRTPRVSAAPATPVVGEVYYDTTLNKLLWWNGTAWVGTDLVYNGAHVPATAYRDGDIVVYNGISYMAVRATSATPTPWPAPYAGPTLVRGGFTGAGAVSKGTGFTIARTGLGFYTITFSTAFAAVPIVVGNCSNGLNDVIVMFYSGTTTQAFVKTRAASAAVDADVDFIAMAV